MGKAQTRQGRMPIIILPAVVVMALAIVAVVAISQMRAKQRAYWTHSMQDSLSVTGEASARANAEASKCWSFAMIVSRRSSEIRACMARGQMAWTTMYDAGEERDEVRKMAKEMDDFVDEGELSVWPKYEALKNTVGQFPTPYREQIGAKIEEVDRSRAYAAKCKNEAHAAFADYDNLVSNEYWQR